MDTSRMFLCTMVHPRLFPGPITDPGNPLKVKMLIEIGTEDLIIRASAASANGKIMGNEPLASIERVTVEHLSGSTQRTAIMRRSLLRMIVMGGIALVIILIVRAYPLGINLLIAMVVAVTTGTLNFVFNGGLGGKDDVVRYHFKQPEYRRAFYLELPSDQAAELHQALLDAGLNLVED